MDEDRLPATDGLIQEGRAGHDYLLSSQQLVVLIAEYALLFVYERPSVAIISNSNLYCQYLATYLSNSISHRFWGIQQFALGPSVIIR